MDYDLQDEYQKKDINVGSSKTRHGFIIFLFSYFIITLILIFLFSSRIESSIEESGIKNIFFGINSVKNIPKTKQLSFVVLTSDGLQVKRYPANYRNMHQAVEMLIKGPDSAALEEGAITGFDENTSLIGLSESNGVYFIDLSSDFLNSGMVLGKEGLDITKSQIFDTLQSQDPTMTNLVIMIDGNPI